MPCKFILILLVLLQQTVRVSVETFTAWNIRQIYLLGLAVMVACTLPSFVCTVRDHQRTMHFILESKCMMLCIALCMNHLIISGAHADAVVFLQVLLPHVFYNLSRAAHENQHKQLLSYREAVRNVSLLASFLFPLMLSVRCPSREVDMAVVLLVMFAGEVMGFAVMLVCAIFRALSSAYESLWQY
jgi:hypothetical protein